MNTDAVSTEPDDVSEQLKKAAELLKAHPHEAAVLLAPEAVVKPAENAPKKGRAAAKALVDAGKARKAAKKATVKKFAKAAPKKGLKRRKGKGGVPATTGQSGPAIEALPWDSLNRKEKLLIGCFNLEGEREVRSIGELAVAAFKTKAKNLAQANSWARNSLRRLIRSGKWLEKVEPGKYRLTPGGRKSLSNA